MIKNAQDILEQWVHAVNEGNTEKLLGFYDSEAVLIPTFSNQMLNTSEQLREYFKKLDVREGLRVKVHDEHLIVQHLENEIVVLSGTYNWRFSVDGELLNFEARFSYVMDLSKPNPILHHHSSQIPQTI